MLYEHRYLDYRDYGGVKFPTEIHVHRGNRFLDDGHDFYEVQVGGVQVNPRVAALTIPDAVRQATVRPVRVESQRVADGVWLIAGGSHNSVAVEFSDFVVVVEAPLNGERSLAVIGEVKRLVPDKPIRYVVNTHHHADHAGGLRTYLTQGAAIVTYEGNREYYEKVVFYPAPQDVRTRLAGPVSGADHLWRIGHVSNRDGQVRLERRYAGRWTFTRCRVSITTPTC